MTRRTRTLPFLCGALAALVGVSAAPAAPAGAAPASATKPLPTIEAAKVRAYDLPGDDGAAIIVEWPRPEDDAGLTYVVEVAPSKDDLAAGKVKTVTVEAGEKALKSANPKYFGFARANQDSCFAEINPADLFPPGPAEVPASEPAALSAAGQAEEKARHDDRKSMDRVRSFVADGLLKASDADRAIAALEINQRPEKELSAVQNADREWVRERLLPYLEKEFQKRDKKQRQEINRATYYFRLAVTEGQRKQYVLDAGAPLVLSAAAKPDFFEWFKLNNLIFSLVFCAVVLASIQVARRNPNLFIRRIPGLDAVDEAIGRATEMGRPVYFVHGLGGVSDLPTMAALTILGRIARRAAEYDIRVRVMNNDPVVTAVSQEVVRQAYTEAGRPDAYNPDDVALVAYDQFSYVAAVQGLMVRQMPAANFLIGSFYAESLLLAETGASTGAIQVAGTDAYMQLPFFITTCDYTLIGEELYAASAYLSREPRMLGSLRGQDIGKAFLMAAIVLVTAGLTIGKICDLNVDWLYSIFKSYGG